MTIPVISFGEYTVTFEAQEEDRTMRYHFINECGWTEAQFRKIQDCAWFCAKVAIWKDGEELACDYLGACSYQTEREFFTRYIGVYFADMVGSCADQIEDKDLSDMVAMWIKKIRKPNGYLQHGAGTNGPFRTESVPIKNEYADKWLARFEGKWRRVHIQVNRTYIVYRGEKITIQIEGL